MGADQPLSLPLVNAASGRFVGGHAHREAAHFPHVFNLHIAVAKTDQLGALQVVFPQNAVDDHLFGESFIFALRAEHPLAKIPVHPQQLCLVQNVHLIGAGCQVRRNVMARKHGVDGFADSGGFAAYGHLAAGYFIGAENGPRALAASGAQQTGKAVDLPFVNLKAEGVRARVAGKADRRVGGHELACADRLPEALAGEFIRGLAEAGHYAAMGARSRTRRTKSAISVSGVENATPDSSGHGKA